MYVNQLRIVNLLVLKSLLKAGVILLFSRGENFLLLEDYATDSPESGVLRLDFIALSLITLSPYRVLSWKDYTLKTYKIKLIFPGITKERYERINLDSVNLYEENRTVTKR